LPQVVEGGTVGGGKIAHVNVIAHGGAVRCGVCVAENGDVRAPEAA